MSVGEEGLAKTPLRVGVGRSGFPPHSCLVWERVGVSSSLGPSSCLYSPECVEGEFCEVRLQDLAYIACERHEDGL